MRREYRQTPPKLIRYTVKTNKLPEKRALRLAVVSDLHGAIYGKDQHILAERILSCAPDIVLMPGDIVESAAWLPGFYQLVKRLRGIPMLMTTGNHEMRLKERDEIKKALIGMGVRVLSGRHILYPFGKRQIVFYGIDDIQHMSETWTESMGGFFVPGKDQTELEQRVQRQLGMLLPCDPGKFNVLIVHRPEHMALYADAGFDLVIAGHAHGGQWRLPGLINGFYAPNQGAFPRFAGGRYEDGSCTMIVGRGLSNHTVIPRLFNPVEVPVIDLMGTLPE